jgi:putative glutamine amidotransferase
MFFKLKGIAIVTLIVLCAGCGTRPAQGTVTIAILDGGVQSSLLRIGVDVNSDYIKALAQQGASVVRCSVRDTPAETDRKLSTASGILVPGGFDIEPSRYHEAPDKKLERTDPALDALEYRVLSYARDRQMPVLGICRGCQALNVFYGGSLYQDIPSQYTVKPPVRHRRSIDLFVYKHATACYHDVRIEKVSGLARLLNAERSRVNTYHHQAARRLAPGFIVSARSDDGVVEAIERTKGGTFILGTQFHPEKMLDEAPAMERIFNAFVRQAAAWSSVRTQAGNGVVAR